LLHLDNSAYHRRLQQELYLKAPALAAHPALYLGWQALALDLLVRLGRRLGRSYPLAAVTYPLSARIRAISY
jgi:hypothetical protein